MTKEHERVAEEIVNGCDLAVDGVMIDSDARWLIKRIAAALAVEGARAHEANRVATLKLFDDMRCVSDPIGPLFGAGWNECLSALRRHVPVVPVYTPPEEQP